MLVLPVAPGVPNFISKVKTKSFVGLVRVAIKLPFVGWNSPACRRRFVLLCSYFSWLTKAAPGKSDSCKIVELLSADIWEGLSCDTLLRSYVFHGEQINIRVNSKIKGNKSEFREIKGRKIAIHPQEETVFKFIDIPHLPPPMGNLTRQTENWMLVPISFLLSIIVPFVELN